ncbi:bola-like protein [Dothidotthia symphoricarpi CBS 119687]|uniref:Bola-like protein n=1 Tax=Dothidotthia symphoricarpi CBS 119687 TaxID=1392245 RepID=A0A6A6A5E2_9PLEO|nr:bola-like protein [Dothidotthia symphoricarpi CBS 119687]KAF2126117.1 bola-like protein [Dothidotthia symphoricarpi CBS 119687]
MAPSRALLRRIARASIHPTPRLLSTSAHTRTPLTIRSQTSSLCSLSARPTPPLLSRPSYSPAHPTRPYSQSAEPPDYLNEAELHVFNKIKAELDPVKLEVQDVSGGCGSMYAIDIESPKFKGLTVIKQHKLVNKVLEAEIKSWHGVQLKTKAV